MPPESRWFRSPSAFFASGALLVIVVAQIVIGRALGSPSEVTLFLGRFHPLVVHLPIGVLVLVGLAELATFSARHRRRIDPALGLALPVLVLVTVTAFVLGHFLGRSGGFAAHALSLHRRLEFLAAVGVCVSAVLFTRQTAEATPSARNAYRGALFVTLGLLSVGAHFGGTVTHGDSYLTEYAPGPFRWLLGGKGKAPAASSAKSPKPKSAAEPLVYADVVAPILEKYCADCHGPKKSKGKLRLDSIEAILKGGEGGPALVAGSSEASELVRRTRLPKDDDDRMPPEDKPAPTPEELAVVAFFIDRGASPTLRVRDTLAPEKGRKLLEAALAGAPSVPGAVATNEAPTAPTPAPAETGSAEAPAKAAPKTPSDDATHGKEASPESPNAKPEPAAAKPEPAAAKPEPAATPAASTAPSGRAVLADRCEKCHGSAKQKGGLRVDSIAALFRGGENGPALVPGSPEDSELIRRIRLPLGQKEHMPPKKETQLTAPEIAALVTWVRSLSQKTAGTASPKATDGQKPHTASTDTAHGETEGASEASTAPDDTASASADSPAVRSSAEPPAAASVSAPADDGPADAALLARVPARIALYEDAVAPLLSRRCAKCHSGPKPAAHLRVDAYAALVEGGLSGPGIVPGKPDESFVCQRISLSPTDDDHMPPADEPPMTPDEVALVRFWVERGGRADLELASKDVPSSPLRAVAEYAHAGGKDSAIHADAGCAACAVGKGSGSRGSALGVAGLVFGALIFRRAARERRNQSSSPAESTRSSSASPAGEPIS